MAVTASEHHQSDIWGSLLKLEYNTPSNPILIMKAPTLALFVWEGAFGLRILLPG